jgi:hypothetical protein
MTEPNLNKGSQPNMEMIPATSIQVADEIGRVPIPNDAIRESDGVNQEDCNRSR